MSIEKIYRLEIPQPDGGVTCEEVSNVQSLRDTLQKHRGNTLYITTGVEDDLGKRIWGNSRIIDFK